MAVGFTNESPLGLSTKLFSDFMPTAAPAGAANTAAIPDSTSTGVVTDLGNQLANRATSGSPSPIMVLLGMVLLLLVIKYLGEWNGTAVDPADLHIGAYNILTVTLAAIIGISSLKLLFNSIQVPGITPLVNFV